MWSRPRFLTLTGTALVLAGATACSSPPPETGAAGADVGCPITVADGWVKAGSEDMTAAFGTLANDSSTGVTVTGASVPGAATVELHEVVDDGGTMTMQRDEDGFAVPAGGSLTLEPGGQHLMLMGLTRPLKAGRDLSITLACASGATTTFTAQVKDFTGAEERYAPSASPS